MDVPGLEFMSPNERDSYIRTQLQKKQQKRMNEARKQFTEFAKQRIQNYTALKKDAKEKQQQKAKEKREESINKLKAELREREKTIGIAHEEAKRFKESYEQELIEDQEIEAKRAENAQQLYREAIKDLRENDPRIAVAERNKRLADAWNAANQIESERLEDYMRKREEERVTVEQLARKMEEERLSRQVPEVYSRMVDVPNLGKIPVNNKADDASRDLDAFSLQQSDKMRRHEELTAERTKKAFLFEKIVAENREFQAELERIHFEEIRRHKLIAMERQTVKEQPSYCIQEFRDNRQKQMESILECPAPKDPPKPEQL